MATVHHLEDLTPPTDVWKLTPPGGLSVLRGREFRAMSMDSPLVDFRDHPVLIGFVQAFREHRPITISPDIIWLLIVQGFAQHVLHAPEQLRAKFVNFEGKKELVVDRRDILWDEATREQLAAFFPAFASQISEYTGQQLTDILTSNFTTSTAATVAASQISIMAGMKEYFDFCMRMDGGSGFPSITIEGTIDDWRAVATKAEFLAQYDLEWWISELREVLREIINAKCGRLNRSFWLEMIRHHEQQDTYDKTYVEGWFVRFFPYYEDGTRSSFSRIYKYDSLPNETLVVPVKVALYDPPTASEPFAFIDGEVEAGFVGLSQDPATFNVKPEIGWIMYSERSADADRRRAEEIMRRNPSIHVRRRVAT